MTVYFQNPGHFEIDLISTMGVNVKETENAIGYFGTGLKYAIAVLLRHGCQIVLENGFDTYEFFVREVHYRGKPFNQLFYRHNGEETRLPFTTDLGKNWSPLSAYRELVSNARDEGGDVYDMRQPHHTVTFTVTGAAIDTARSKHNELFLTSKPIEVVNGVEVHSGSTSRIYYRGIYVGVFNSSGSWGNTYNITSEMQLTEDRTLANPWNAYYAIRGAIPHLTNRSIINNALRSGENHELYSPMSPSTATPTDAFLDYLAENRHRAHIKQTADAFLSRFRPETPDIQPVALPPHNEADIEAALTLLEPLCHLERTDFSVVESLGPDVYGLYDSSTDDVYITRQTVANGVNFIAATLYEEWCHKKHGYLDHSRGFQQYLIDTVINLTRQIAEGAKA